MAELINGDVVKATNRREESSVKAKTTEQDQREKRKVVQERMGKPRHKLTTAHNPHHYPQHTDYHRDQAFYQSQSGGRYRGHRYVSHDDWRWTTDQQQWTNDFDACRDGEYRHYYHRGNKSSRKTGSGIDSGPDTSRPSNKRLSNQSLSEDKGSSRPSDRQKEAVVDKQQEYKTDTNSMDGQVATGDAQPKVEITEHFADKDKETVVNPPGKYRAKKSGYKSVPNAKKCEEISSSTVSRPDSTTTARSHKRKHKEERAVNNKVVEKSKEDKESGKGAIAKDSSVNVPGKYHVKKGTFKSATSSTNAEEDKQIDAVSDTASTHGQKRRDYKAKNFRPVKRYGGVASSIQSDVLSQQLFSGQYECMVCCDRVRVKDPVWNCSTCYHIFHLKCIKKWAKIPTDLENDVSKEEGWRCPGCRTPSSVVPSVYKCFCGKMVDPLWTPSNKFQVPHSCGELCGKRLATDKSMACMHKCRLLCHPGPCPPCPVTVSTYCPCGKKPVQVRCSNTTNVQSCGSTCGKALECGRHHCDLLCHTGPCPKCHQPITLHCYCGKASRESVCGEELIGSYSCGKRCSSLLDCGNHICERVCHEGACESCTLLPDHVTRCPCGSTPLMELLMSERTSCLDPIPTCTSRCGKPLPCSTPDDRHFCEDKCHLDDCAVCDKQSTITCRCGKTTEVIPCRQLEERRGFECDRVCNKKLTCGRHRCSNKCCVDSEHMCDRLCGKRLQCGRHFCQNNCHGGHCERCWEISYDELTCHCGAEMLLPPIPCGTLPPVCSRPCSRLHLCNHTVTHTCHADNESCPPCTVLAEKMCMGGHEMRKNIPCHMTEVSCGTPCGKDLPCGAHKCQRVCHKDACLAEGEPCQQLCVKQRILCEHICAAPCHPNERCPATKCKAMVTIRCPCGRRCNKVQCSVDERHAYQSLRSEQLNNIMMDLQSGQTISIHDVTLGDHSHKLECDETCAQEERNRKLAEALEIENPDVTADTNLHYSPFLLDYAKNDIKFVLQIEDKLKTLVENSLKTNTTGKVSFSVMKSNQRRLVHELAGYFTCDTYSLDPEPLRNVVAIATKKSTIPTVMLSQAAQMKKVMPAPVKNIPREQPTSTMVTLTKNKNTTQSADSKNTKSVDYFADDADL